MALIWLPNESDPAAQIKVVRAAALMNFLPLVIKAACLRGMINGPQRSCRPSASIPANAVARKLPKPGTGLVQGHRCHREGEGTGNGGQTRAQAGRAGTRAGTGAVTPAHAAGTGTSGGAGAAICSPQRGSPRSAMAGVPGAAGGALWQAGCRGDSGVSHHVPSPGTTTQAPTPRPVPSLSAGQSLDPPTARGDTGAPNCHLWCGLAFSQQRTSSTGAKSWAKHVGAGTAAQSPPLPPVPRELCLRTQRPPAFCSKLLATANHPGSLPAGTANHSLLPPPPASNPQCRAQEPAGPSPSEPRPLPSAPRAVPCLRCAALRGHVPALPRSAGLTHLPSPCQRSAMPPFSTGRPHSS